MAAPSLLGVGFEGKLVRRDIDETYDSSVYQYASSSYKAENLVNPKAIIYPAGDADVIKAIEYAKKNGLGIALRTGGHHYTGASSTNGENLQLDLNDTYTDVVWASESEDPTQTIVTVGISSTLIKFMDKLRAKRRFVPTGQCSYVHLGGHVQTGGYGHLIRSFGLFADCVQKVRIITADGQIRTVRRGVEEDKELFFAILGGSPGNFGVLTDITLKVYRDEDHPKSRGLVGRLPYSPKLFNALMEVMVAQEWADVAPDFDYSLSVVSGRKVEEKPGPGIVLFAQWANLEGKDQEYDDRFFKAIKKAIGNNSLNPHDGMAINDREAPMSTLCSFWVFPIAREFQLPYFKRAYITEASPKTLIKNEWVKWTTERLNEVLAKPEDRHYIAAQFSHLGGTKSRFHVNDPNNDMSFSWRRDSTFACTMDIFYNPAGSEGEAAKKKAQEWVDKNDKEAVGKCGKFSNEDRRLLWGSKDTDLPAARAHYYDSSEKYDRLVKTKEEFDPALVFTANRFAVGRSRVQPEPAKPEPQAPGKIVSDGGHGRSRWCGLL